MEDDVVAVHREALWLRRGVAGVVLLAAILIGLLAFAIVMRTASAWQLLGAGRGLVPEEYYPYSGFVVIFAMTLGHFGGWAAGSALLVHAWSLLRRRPMTSAGLRSAMIVAYLGLAIVPLALYHLFFGPPLLGLPREGLEAWLAETYPDAHLLLYTTHPVVDLSVIPLGGAVTGILWWASDERLAGRGLQLLLALLVMATSLAVALSLGIHSVLAHIRL